MFHLKSHQNLIALFCIIFFLFGNKIYAQTIYQVSSATQLNNVLNNDADPGDVILVTADIDVAVSITKDNSGTNNNPIIIKALNFASTKITKKITFSNTSNNLVLSGFKFSDGGNIFILGRKIRITQCSFDNTCTESPWLWVDNRDTPKPKYIEVDHCIFEGKNNNLYPGKIILLALANGEVEHHHIHHNHFKNTIAGSSNGYEIIQVIASNANYENDSVVVEYNLFEDCNNYGGEGELVSIKSSCNFFRYNVIRECEGGVVFRHGDNNKAEGNFFYGGSKPNSMGIRIQGKDHVIVNNYFNGILGKYALGFNSNATEPPCSSEYDEIDNAQIINNTWINCNTSFWIQSPREKMGEKDSPPKNCEIINNIFLSNETIFKQENDLDNFLFQTNIYWGSLLGLPSTYSSGFQNVDPQLEINSVNVHIPLSTSPAIDNATDNINVENDIFGNSRTSSSIDIGAVEYPSDYLSRPPVNEDLAGSKGLVGYWSFNGDADDKSGYGSTSLIIGATLTSDRNNKSQNAYSFDGTNDFINIGNNDCIKPDLPFTIAAWVYLESGATSYPIFLNNYVENYYYGVELNIVGNNQLAVRLGDGGLIGPGSRRSKKGTTSLLFNEWYFVTAVIRSETDIDLYINADNDGGTYTGSGNTIAYNFEPGRVGQDDGSMHSGGEHFFKGKIDELRLYNYELTVSEIETIFNYTGVSYDHTKKYATTKDIRKNFELNQNYPNPFNPLTKIKYTLPKAGNVKIEVFNLLGQKVETLVNKQMPAGSHEVRFDAMNLPSGVYLYKIKSGDYQEMKKMILLQ